MRRPFWTDCFCLIKSRQVKHVANLQIKLINYPECLFARKMLQTAT